VTSVSPRVDRRLLEAAEALDDPTQPLAETWRKVCLAAEDLGVTRPGYDTIRMVVREHRHRRDERRRLLEPVVSDAFRGRVSAWDVERIVEAAALVGSRSRPRP
jgi:siroheme synthase (precorrin-2 oxidase/ferrochelatase)